MIKRPSTKTSVLRHWGFGLLSSSVFRHSSFPVARHDCAEEQFRQRFCRTGPGVFLRKRAALQRRRISSTARSSRRWRRRSRARWRKSAISSSKPAPASANRSPISCRRFFSRSSKHKKAIISTHTINLQEQLLHKDIPIVKKILPVEFEAALMKGPAELSLSAATGARVAASQRAFHHVRSKPSSNATRRLGAHDDGRFAERFAIEPDPKVWAQVCSEAHICTAKTCGQDPRLFFSAGAQTVARGAT